MNSFSKKHHVIVHIKFSNLVAIKKQVMWYSVHIQSNKLA